LTTVNFPSLISASGNFNISGNGNLTVLSASFLSLVESNINLSSNTSLTTFDLPSLSYLGGNFNAQGCTLDETSVNNILIKLNDISWAAGGKDCYLDGGTSEAPTGDGILAKDSMLSASANIVTN